MHQTSFLRYVLKPLARKAGIADVSLQVLRRTCATHFGAKANPKDTQAQLRHADPYTTLKYYQQSIPESVKAAAVAFEAELRANVRNATALQ
jgi:integrase